MSKSARELVFATNNPHKLLEVQHILGESFKLLSLQDINLTEEIPEDHDTLEKNALQKAWYIYNKSAVSCFADDTGLEVDALDGKPGVYSARYAGEGKNSKDNIKKLLKELQGVKNRKARFRTVIALIVDGNEHLFEGIVNGLIIDYERGEDGFGYDPIFQPDGFSLTFAQMPLDQKNDISHRARAVNHLADFLMKQ
ncbi:MAG: non-canonical purine NTP diphosphatase [Bacteroidales bacterium]|nr:MAG: non-canonical purine NTP diphosphatase [Bacteroidales bacterium]